MEPNRAGPEPDRWLRGFFLALLALTVVRGVLYAILNPPFGSPDEMDHFHYVASLATGGAAGPRGREGHQPVLYYALVAPAYWLTAGRSVAVQLLAIRLWSVPFLLGQLLFVWLSARKVAPGNRVVAVVATGFVALLPQSTLVAASINNDNAANLVASALTYVVISLLLGGRWGLVPTGVAAMGLAVLSKGQLLPMAVLTGVVILWYLLERAASRRSARPLLWLLALPAAALPMAARESGVLIQRSQWELATLGRMPAALAAAGQRGTTPYEYQLSSFFAAFLGESLRPAGWWYLLPLGVLGVAALGYVLGAWGLVRGERGVDWRQAAVRAALVLIVAMQWAVVYLIFLQHELVTGFPWKLQYMQGRYLFPFLTAAGLLLGEGWSLALRRLRLPAACALGAIAVLALFDAAALASLVGYYAWP